MTGGHDASTEASNDAFHDEPDPGTNAWSLLYADAPLRPTSCPDCGNVFATDSTSCPWCGRIVASSEPIAPVGDPEEPTATSSALASGPVAADRAEPAISAADATAAYQARRSRDAEHAAGLRRWASMLLAGAVLLVIATGLTIRARDQNHKKVLAGATTSSPATVSGGASTSTGSTASTTAVSTEVTTATTTDTATTATTDTSAATASTAPITIATTTATTAAARFTPEQQQALDLAQSLSDALAGKNWSRVRELTQATAVTDAQFEGVYGNLTKVSLVPAKIDKLSESSYDVFAGVIQVKGSGSAATSTVYCNKYTVDVLAKTVTKIRSTDPLRQQPGTIEPASVTDELATTCTTPNLNA